MQEREQLKQWASSVLSKAELYGEASIGVLHAEIRQGLRGMYKANPEIGDEQAARIVADTVITKFAGGAKIQAESLASYLKSYGKDGPYKAALAFARDVRSEFAGVAGGDENGMDLG